jgi:hypothetical protein
VTTESAGLLDASRDQDQARAQGCELGIVTRIVKVDDPREADLEDASKGPFAVVEGDQPQHFGGVQGRAQLPKEALVGALHKAFFVGSAQLVQLKEGFELVQTLPDHKPALAQALGTSHLSFELVAGLAREKAEIGREISGQVDIGRLVRKLDPIFVATITQSPGIRAQVRKAKRGIPSRGFLTQVRPKFGLGTQPIQSVGNVLTTQKLPGVGCAMKKDETTILPHA